MDAAEILPAYEGTLVHNCWQSYFQYGLTKHTLYNTHLLRKPRGITENTDQPWAKKIALLLLEMKAGREAKKNSYYYRRKHSDRYDEILNEFIFNSSEAE